jgi:hypothetical protein
MARFFNKSVYSYNKFNFKTRFYDPQKEKLEELKSNAEANNSLNLDGSVNEEMLRRRMNRSKANFDRNEKMDANRSRRLIFLMLLLVGAVFIFFKFVNNIDSGVTYIYENNQKTSVPK